MNIRVVGYWEGYPEIDVKGVEQNPNPLTEVEDYYTHIPIAFCAPIKANPNDKLASDWEFDQSFTKENTKANIFAQIQQIKSRPGNTQKFLLSFQDTPSTHWFPDVDIDAFAKKISADCYQYNIDGYDVDAESGMREYLATKQDIATDPYVLTFSAIIKALRREFDALAPLHPNQSKKIISYTCYTGSDFDKQILGICKNEIDYLTTMSYWNNCQGNIDLFNLYAGFIGDPNKVGVGVECPPGGTDIEETKKFFTWLSNNKDITDKTGMVWSETRNNQYKDISYGKVISDILHGVSNKDTASQNSSLGHQNLNSANNLNNTEHKPILDPVKPKDNTLKKLGKSVQKLFCPCWGMEKSTPKGYMAIPTREEPKIDTKIKHK